jgi:vacuolar-type H+-ATPase subunit I/STV1
MNEIITYFTIYGIPVANLFIGAIMTLIGFKIYKPFKKDKEEEYNRKYGDFYKIAGIAIFLYGFIKLINLLT